MISSWFSNVSAFAISSNSVVNGVSGWVITSLADFFVLTNSIKSCFALSKLKYPWGPKVIKSKSGKYEQNGDISFKKPISCHLYPIRIKKYKDSNDTYLARTYMVNNCTAPNKCTFPVRNVDQVF